MSRRKKFATLDEGQQQITSFFARVPRPGTASVQTNHPNAVQQQVTSLIGGALNPGAARVQTAPPPLSPSMPVRRSRDVSSPPSQLSSHKFLPTAHVNDGVLSAIEKKEEEVVCGDKMDVDSCDDSFAKCVKPIYADDFGLSPHQKSAQLSEEEDEDEEEEDLSAVLRRPNSKDAQKFKVAYDHYTESDEEDKSYPTEFNRGAMESFLVEQQSSSKCTKLIKPLTDDELSPVLRRPNSKGVQKFKDDYGSDTESDVEDDDTYPTEFNRGEMKSFLAEQQSSSKCTEFMKPLTDDELMPMDRRPNSRGVQKFKVDYGSDTESDNEDNNYYPTEFNQGEMESFLVEQQSSSKCSTFMKPLSGDELMPMNRRSISKKVQEFKERYASDTESDEKDGDTYPTEFNRGEMESFLAEQQSSSKCTTFTKPLPPAAIQQSRKSSLPLLSNQFSSRSSSLGQHQPIEVIEIDDDDEVVLQSAVTYSLANKTIKMPNVTKYEKIKNILIDCQQLTQEIVDSVFECISLKHQLSFKLFKVNQLRNGFICLLKESHMVSSSVKHNFYHNGIFLSLSNHIKRCQNISQEDLVKIYYGNDDTKVKQLLNQELASETKMFIIELMKVEYNSLQPTNEQVFDDHAVSLLKGSQLGFIWTLNPFEKSVLNLFELSTDIPNSLNCLLHHTKDKENLGKNIGFSDKSYNDCKTGKTIFGSSYLAPYVDHLEHVHQVTVSMLRQNSEIVNSGKTFKITSNPKKEVIQLFLKERSRLRGDAITPLFQILTTETSTDKPIIYELLKPFAYYTLKFFSGDLKEKTFSCRLEHTKSVGKSFKMSIVKNASGGVTCLRSLQKHLVCHNINLRTIGNILATNSSIKDIFEGPLLPDTQTLAISECHRLLKEHYGKEEQAEAERQTLIAKAIQSTSPYSSVQQNDPSFVRAIILQMFPHCLIDYLNDEENFIKEANQLEKEALSTIRNNLQNPDLNAECYTFSLRPITSDISGFLDVLIYVGQTCSNVFHHRDIAHIKFIVDASNQMATHSQNLYEYIANAINNKQDVFKHIMSKGISKEESEFKEHCVALFLYSSTLLQNNQVGKPTQFSSFANFKMNDFAKIGCFMIIKQFKELNFNKSMNFKTELWADFNKSYLTSQVKSAFLLALNQQIPHELSLVYGSSENYDSTVYAVHLFLSIFTFPPRMAYMYLHSQVDLSSEELKEAVAVVVTNHPKSFKDCVERARSYFHLIFIQNVKEANKVLEKMGASYRRYPSVEESDHAKSFIKAAAILFARLYKIDAPADNEINSLLYNSTHPITVLSPSRPPVNRITKFADLNQLLSPAHNIDLQILEKLKSIGFGVNPINMFVDDQNVVQFLHATRLLRDRNFIKNSPGRTYRYAQKHSLYFLNSHKFPWFYK